METKKVSDKYKLLELKSKVLLGQKVNLVPFNENHFKNKNYLSWLHDYEVIKYLNLPSYLESPVRFEEVENYANHLMKSETTFFYAVETVDHQFIGTFKIGPIDWHAKNANLGILIGDKNFWGKGVGKELFSIAIQFCFSDLEMHKVYGGCMNPNVGMKNVFLKLQFKEEGRFIEQDLLEGKYYDHLRFGLLRREYQEHLKS